MARMSELEQRIRERMAQAKAKLPDLDAKIDSAQDVLARLTLERTAIVMGIEGDEQLLCGAQPKQPRVRKARKVRAPDGEAQPAGGDGQGEKEM